LLQTSPEGTKLLFTRLKKTSPGSSCLRLIGKRREDVAAVMRTVFMVLALFLCGWVEPTLAQEPFYKGKTIRLIVGTDPGGGFDTYSRAIARHMSRHIPGGPTIVVENMPGAAHLISANYIYKIAKPDGLTMGNFTGTLLLGQVLKRPGIEFDARKFEYVGAPSRDVSTCALAKRSGVGTLQQWIGSKNVVKIGGIGPGDFTYEIPKILEFALGLPVQVVAGYKGTAPIRLAVEGGEVDGVCMDWNSIKATWRKALDSGDVKVVVQITPRVHPELSDIPRASDFANTAEGRRLIQVGIYDRGTIFRPYMLPPGVSPERVQLLRAAFAETLKDPLFLADAKKSNLVIDGVSGNELEKIAVEMFKLDAATAGKLNDILK
jgi:tripartite-type tricarboxylate transporter receptor subunit TctC